MVRPLAALGAGTSFVGGVPKLLERAVGAFWRQAPGAIQHPAQGGGIEGAGRARTPMCRQALAAGPCIALRCAVLLALPAAAAA